MTMILTAIKKIFIIIRYKYSIINLLLKILNIQVYLDKKKLNQK